MRTQHSRTFNMFITIDNQQHCHDNDLH